MDKFKKIVVYANIGLIIALSIAIIYTIWFDNLDDLFWKILSTYAVVVFSTYVIMKYFDYVDRKAVKGDKK